MRRCVVKVNEELHECSFEKDSVRGHVKTVLFLVFIPTFNQRLQWFV